MRVEFKTDKRGYTMVLQRDLLGSFVLLRRWYGLHNRRGGFKQQIFEDELTAQKEFLRISKLRGRRGYSQVGKIKH
jgi:predicted DNA-binding WGR domain protein